jgi:hypothetical protein
MTSKAFNHLWVAESAIREELQHVQETMRIYVYPLTPGGPRNLSDFIAHAIRDKEHACVETYKAWAYFMERLVASPVYTENPEAADLFLIPQWETLNKGQQYRDDLVRPLEKAIASKLYADTSPRRNHLFIYNSDDSPLSEERIPPSIRDHLRDRFIRISYSGRDSDWGQFHVDRECRGDDFDPTHEIVVPPVVPVDCRGYRSPGRGRRHDFYYRGALRPPAEQVERSRFLDYATSFVDVTTDHDAYFGLHSAGWGIWTARLYNYLNLSIVPVISSDGVILPFERLLNYRAFTVKLLAETYAKNQDPSALARLQKAARAARLHARDSTDLQSETAALANRLYGMQRNAKAASYWLDWRSRDEFRNPFTLLLIELYGFVDHRYRRDIRRPVARDEYCEI